MDSTVAMHKVGIPDMRNHLNYFILNECHKLIQNPQWSIKISHYYWESNKVADALANVGVNQPTLLIMYNDPPHSLLSLLFEDDIGVTWPKVVCNV